MYSLKTKQFHKIFNFSKLFATKIKIEIILKKLYQQSLHHIKKDCSCVLIDDKIQQENNIKYLIKN